MKVAVLGGSFNPLHIGHLVLAEDVCVSLGYDRIFFIPVFSPPHKEMTGAASGIDRLEMIHCACASDNRFMAESCELERGGTSYTYDTIAFLEQKYSGVIEGKIGLIIGQDLAAEFYKWYRSDDLAGKTDIILAQRPEENTSEMLKTFSNHPSGDYTGVTSTKYELENFSYSHVLLDNPVLPVSSTEIRARIARGKSWRYLVPEPVYHYIIQRRLYGYKE